MRNAVEFIDETEDNELEQGDLDYKNKLHQARSIMLFISQELRGFNSRRVAIPALCDNLVLYARTETYFTPNDDYYKCIGKEVLIRKCDVAGQATDQETLEQAVRD